MKRHIMCSLLAAMLMATTVACVSVHAESSDAEAAALVRDTTYGPVTGIEDSDSGALIWYGIPYGAAPVEDLRWAPPADPDAWTDALDCTEPAEPGMQYAMDYATGENNLIGTEDCLNLDIYSRPDAENLPVLVYVHGGNNQTGHSREIPGKQIVFDNNCIYVSLNYRLGLFGFNCLPALVSGEDATGNFTMLDIAKALDWVKENIAAFGGDPENITISGFSAGGRDVMAMLVSPLFAGKFNKAIAFSGGMTIADQTASASQIAWAIAPLAVEDGLFEDEAEAQKWLLTDGDDVREFLFGLTPDRVCALMGNAGIRMSAFPHLYNDGIVLPEEGFDTDTYNQVPLLMLTGATEFSLFCNFDGYFFSPAMTELDEETQEAAKTFARIYGSDMYRIFNGQCSAQKMFDKYQEKIYLAQVEYGSVNSATFLPAMGSFHGIFVPMLTNDHTYGSFGDFTAEGFQAMASEFDQYLANFLASGDPNADGLTEWPAWTPENNTSMVFDADETTPVIEAKDVSTTYEDIMARMDADETITEDVKMNMIRNVMNGRWFSAAMDEHYGNESLWH